MASHANRPRLPLLLGVPGIDYVKLTEYSFGGESFNVTPRQKKITNMEGSFPADALGLIAAHSIKHDQSRLAAAAVAVSMVLSTRSETR